MNYIMGVKKANYGKHLGSNLNFTSLFPMSLRNQSAIKESKRGSDIEI